MTKTYKKPVQSNDHLDLNVATVSGIGAATSKKSRNGTFKNSPKPQKGTLKNFAISGTVFKNNIKRPNEHMVLLNANHT